MRAGLFSDKLKRACKDKVNEGHGEEEHTPMMPPKETAIAAAVGSIIAGLRNGELSPDGAADRLESLKRQLYKLRLEEGNLQEAPMNNGLRDAVRMGIECLEKTRPDELGLDDERHMNAIAALKALEAQLYAATLEEGELDEGTLEEYGIAYGIDRSGRVDKTNRLNKPTKEQMGCRDRDTGELVDHHRS